MSAFSLSGWMAGFSSVIFGFFVYLKTTNRRMGIVWLFFCCSVAAYGFGTAWVGSARVPEESLLAWRLMYATGVIWIAPLFYHFTTVFLERPRARSVMVHYTISLFFLGTLPSHVFFYKVLPLFKGFLYAQGGVLFPYYLLWWAGVIVYSHGWILHEYGGLSAVKKRQAIYFFMGTAIGFVGGSISYIGSFGLAVYPWGNFTVCLYPMIMAFAIVRHQLMDVRVILRRTLVYSGITLALSSVYVAILVLITHTLEGHVLSPGVYSSIGAACAEIKRPLATISLPVQLALAELETLKPTRPEEAATLEKVRSRLRYVIDQAQDVGQRIEAIRELSASEAPEHNPLPLPALLRRCLENEAARCKKYRIDWRYEEDHQEAIVNGNADQLQLLFRNLIANAIEALSAFPEDLERTLTVRSKQLENACEVRIQDNGPGMDAQHLAKLFEPYFTTKGAAGTGLGLYLARQIAERHGGAILVSSEPGHGTEFLITLPRLML